MPRGDGMPMVRWLSRMPVVSSVGKRVFFAIKGRGDAGVIRRVSEAPYPQGARICSALPSNRGPLAGRDRERVERIEEQRELLRRRDEPLVDGTLPDGEIEDRGILVEATWPDKVPTIMGDPDQLKQAFYNIINNALQAMPDGGLLRIVCTVVMCWASYVAPPM